jgi:hypothetical protein
MILKSTLAHSSFHSSHACKPGLLNYAFIEKTMFRFMTWKSKAATTNNKRKVPISFQDLTHRIHRRTAKSTGILVDNLTGTVDLVQKYENFIKKHWDRKQTATDSGRNQRQDC